MLHRELEGESRACPLRWRRVSTEADPIELREATDGPPRATLRSELGRLCYDCDGRRSSSRWMKRCLCGLWKSTRFWNGRHHWLAWICRATHRDGCRAKRVWRWDAWVTNSLRDLWVVVVKKLDLASCWVGSPSLVSCRKQERAWTMTGTSTRRAKWRSHAGLAVLPRHVGLPTCCCVRRGWDVVRARPVERRRRDEGMIPRRPMDVL